MKAVIYKEPFSVAVEDVPDPEIQHPNDVIVKITSSCICGSDLHMYEGRTAAEPGIVFGHENMGVIQEVGPAVAKAARAAFEGPSAAAVLIAQKLVGIKTFEIGTGR